MTKSNLQEAHRPQTPSLPVLSCQGQQDELNSNRQQFVSSLTMEIVAETRAVRILRYAVMFVLLITGILVSTGVYLYTFNEEQDNFTTRFEDSAQQVIDSFHDSVERNLGAVAELSAAYTSYALHSNSTFPNVTLPNFATVGSHFRIHSGSHIVHWLPLVTEEGRLEWEAYANQTRFHIDTEFQKDDQFRKKQDEKLLGNDDRSRTRSLQEEQKQPMSVLKDGSGFHSKIWSNGAMVPAGDEPAGSGPYLPSWQRSPISAQRQRAMNLNWAHTKAIGPGLLPVMLKEKKAVLRNAAIPIPFMLERLQKNLAISQYREKAQAYADGLSTFLAYPVFDSFNEDANVVGVLASNVYWKILLTRLLPSSSKGILVVVENSFNQTFSFRLDGSKATNLGMGDPHDSKYDHLRVSENVNTYLAQRASARTRAYTTVDISDTSQYIIHVYPTQDTEDQFVTMKPVIYTLVVILGFLLASALFLLFSHHVERRQRIMIAKVVENADRVTATERELNEFLAHEVRNPLSAAISAASFVTSAINEDKPLSDIKGQHEAREDMEVVNASLNFINDFLRSMLDIHRADGNKITIIKGPTDVLRDVLEPVKMTLHSRVANFEVQIKCSDNLIVETDAIRLKQVILNLVRNATKFVEKGFIRMRANVVDQNVRLYVEDSGPGIPAERREGLFAKYQLSLDLLSQGTGLGLNLCKKLMASMDGDIWLDESYASGMEDYPGACFVVDLNSGPIDIESALPTDDDGDSSENTIPLDSTSAASGSGDVAIREGELEVVETTDASTRDDSRRDIESANDGSSVSLLSSPSARISSQRRTAARLPPEELPDGELPTNLSVLFVDDDAVLRKLFMRAVKRVAPTWKIQEASSGEMALQLCEEEEFSVIFLDQYMASVDKQLLGTETAQKMRSKGVRALICGLSANDLGDSFLSSGADNFILKPMPCKPADLRGVLLNILPEKLSDGDETAPLWT